MLRKRPEDRPHQLAAEEQVGRHVEIVAQGEVLVDRLDAEVLGVARAADRGLLPVEQDLAGVGGERAGQDLDQGRLAGAVVAEQRHHLVAMTERSTFCANR